MKKLLIIVPLIVLCNCRIGWYIHKTETSVNAATNEVWVRETEEIRIKIKKATIQQLRNER